MKRSIALLTLLGAAAGAGAKTTVYGAANGMTYVENTDPGTSLEVDADLSHFGFRGDAAITPSVKAVFDSRFYADILDLNTGSIAVALRGHLGLAGPFGTVRLFGGPTPLSKTQSYLTLMEEDPTEVSLALGGAILTTNAVLPTGAEYNTGINYTSAELQGGLSFDGAILPAQDPDGNTGFSVAANLTQAQFRASAAFEVNGVADSTQIVRLVGEYDLGDLTLGGLVQMAGNSDQDLNGTSVVGFARMPVRVTQWPTRLQINGGFAHQENDADTLDESQTYLSAVHEIQYSDQVSSYTFGELSLPEESAGNVSRFGVGMKVRF